MREIPYDRIVGTVAAMCQRANYELGADVMKSFRQALKKEESETGREVLSQLIENAEIASAERVPMCQDTGYAVFLVELGQDTRIVGGSLYDAIHEGVRKGYAEGYLRNSVVGHPLERKNTGDNTPAVIHLELVHGDRLTLHFSAKGGGSENMSALKMLKPSDGLEGVKAFILDTVRQAGPNACPPVIVGVGIGGTFEKAAYLAKKSLFRPVGERSPRPEIAALESELLDACNKLGIGPQGMGGRTTALDVKIEIHPCHIASLPVAVNLNCHASRHQEAVI
ncbi:fumarate hydratase [Brevibacillus composti]|uniref:Fumarate hydratase n=1 Tax=Brevibacillus composti TaxID=2796470 RepID=A0A7T5JMZ3_9BACL|nr:fumarate hydratase [Brevibacillus composti]QQE73607.1 fumarate hydratase [Brevibacillus composti]QUO40689.1 fumarate hydratase [Brevibacillus composti]